MYRKSLIQRRRTLQQDAKKQLRPCVVHGCRASYTVTKNSVMVGYEKEKTKLLRKQAAELVFILSVRYQFEIFWIQSNDA